MESLVACPQTGARGQRDGRQEVYVDIAEAFAMDAMAIDERMLIRITPARLKHWRAE